MALKILLADDSMTAQNMGKKILVDAGYDLIAVSNGAAALKKIAELKPDLVVLDIYMPGYTGLEVCERLKSAPETARMPVLLTVGKMEPYRAEDGAKVRADGVIIKPFEASDLIAAVAKLAEMIAPPPVEVAAENAIVDDDLADSGTLPWNPQAPDETHDPVGATDFAAMMSAPALMDELSVEPAPAVPAFEDSAAMRIDLNPPKSPNFEISAPEPFEMAPPPAMAMAMAAIPTFGIEEPAFPVIAPSAVVEPPAEVVNAAALSVFDVPVEEERELTPEHHDVSVPTASVLSVVEDAFTPETNAADSMESVASDVMPLEDLEFTSVPQVGEVESLHEDALEITPEKQEVVISDAHDPALATAPEDFSSFLVRVGDNEVEPLRAEVVQPKQELPESAVDDVPMAHVELAPPAVPLQAEEPQEVVSAEVPATPDERAVSSGWVAVEEPVSADEALAFDSPISFETPVAVEAEAVLEPPNADPVFAPDLASPGVEQAVQEIETPIPHVSEINAIFAEELPHLEPAAMDGEEARVVLANGSVLLQDEIGSYSQTTAEPSPVAVNAPVEQVFMPAAEAEHPELLPDALDAPPEVPANAVSEPAVALRDEDMEFEAAVQAALNEIPQDADLLDGNASTTESTTVPPAETDSVFEPMGAAESDASATFESFAVANAASPVLGDEEPLSAMEAVPEPGPGDAVETDTERLVGVDCPIASAEQQPPTDSLEVALAATASAGSQQIAQPDAARIADVVQRVFNRYKEQMVSEIARELADEQ